MRTNMAEALSQNQIDELLNRMKSGESETIELESKTKVKEYDFSLPKKFTKDQLKSLNSLFENYSRMMSSYFTGVLRSACEVSIGQIEEQRYYEFSNALPDKTLIGIISLCPEGKMFNEATTMVELSTSFGYLLIDRLMGGNGELYIPDRDYTEIELALLKMVMQNVSQYLQEAFNSFMPAKAEVRTMETNGRFIQAFSPQDMVVFISLDIDCELYQGLANICMPTESLEQVISYFSEKYKHNSKQQDEEKENIKRDCILSSIKESEVMLEAHLDDCVMTLGEILQLQVNDAISLNRKISEDIPVQVEGIPLFKARLGESNLQRALKVVSTSDDLFG